MVSLLSLSARDAAVQRGLLLHAVCPGCLWLAHIPDEEAHLWTLPPGQILLVSGHLPSHSTFPSALMFFLGLGTLSFTSLLSIAPLSLPLFPSHPSLSFLLIPFFRSLSNSATSYSNVFLLTLSLPPFPSLGVSQPVLSSGVC